MTQAQGYQRLHSIGVEFHYNLRKEEKISLHLYIGSDNYTFKRLSKFTTSKLILPNGDNVTSKFGKGEAGRIRNEETSKLAENIITRNRRLDSKIITAVEVAKNKNVQFDAIITNVQLATVLQESRHFKKDIRSKNYYQRNCKEKIYRVGYLDLTNGTILDIFVNPELEWSDNTLVLFTKLSEEIQSSLESLTSALTIATQNDFGWL